MTTLTYKLLPFAVKADTQAATKPVLGVDTTGTLTLPTPLGATTRGIPFKGADGATYYLQVTTTVPS
jgi:hypothetical protein